MRIIEVIKAHFFYKLIALILALVTYFYIQGEIGGNTQGIDEKILRNLASKVVPVRVEIKGEPPPGYKVLDANIKIKPEKVIIIGKKGDLDLINEISTEPIDVRKFTHTQIVYVPLVPVRNAINVGTKIVEVEIPIIVVK
jgi:YbbR domain-containing protein